MVNKKILFNAGESTLGPKRYCNRKMCVYEMKRGQGGREGG